MGRLLVSSMIAGVMAAWPAAQPPRTGIAEGVTRLTRDTAWTLSATIPVRFVTHHPQGMVRIGSTFFVSSVEIKVRTRRFPQPVDGYDRDTGEGVGHLFKFDAGGRLLADLRLGEGAIYHPGGIDYDGTHIWVPVAEYRPNSRSILYRVEPESMKAAEVLRVDDHIGALVHDTEGRLLHGVSWGSRRFHRWQVGHDRRPGASAAAGPAPNTSHYVDYQDCKYVGSRRMLCTGVTELRPAAGGPPFRLGGIDLVDLRDLRPIHQVPLLLWTPGGLSMAQNPAWFEADAAAGVLRGYFMPEDDRSSVYIYETRVN